MGKAELTSERLTIRPLVPADAAELAALHADPGVMHFIGSGVRTPETAAREAQRLIAAGDDPVLGPRGIERRVDRAFLGWVGIIALEGGPEREIGYRLHRRHWNQGYAREATARLLAHGFDDLAIPRIVAVTALENIRSQRVLTAIGFTLVDRRRVYGVDGCLYYESLSVDAHGE